MRGGYRHGVGIRQGAPFIAQRTALDELAQIFALYLRQYPAVQIVYSGTMIDPRSVEELSTPYDLPDIETTDGRRLPASLEIVEWRIKAERRLFFCDANEFPLDETSPGIHAPGFDFTVYMKSDYFAELLASNILDLAKMDPAVEGCLHEPKRLCETIFEGAPPKRRGLVEKWRDERIYPYEGGTDECHRESRAGGLQRLSPQREYLPAGVLHLR